MGLVNTIKDYIEKREFKKYLKKNEWQGLIPGDIIEYKDKKIIYCGINRNGGPGMMGVQEPFFGPAYPSDPKCVYYLRQISEAFPEEIFGENARPILVGVTDVSIGFLNATRRDLELVGHITPEEWDIMVKELEKGIGTGPY